MTNVEGSLITWIVTIGVGVIVVGLVKYIFKRERESLLTKEEHSNICHGNLKEFREEFTRILDDRIENKILREMRELNGKR
jgi:hypothetical protein